MGGSKRDGSGNRKRSVLRLADRAARLRLGALEIARAEAPEEVLINAVDRAYKNERLRERRASSRPRTQSK